MTYEEFLKSKIIVAPRHGLVDDDPDFQINKMLKPHQVDSVNWAVRGGRRALFLSFGLGKTFIQLETLRVLQGILGGRFLVVAPLGVRLEFAADAAKLGIHIKFVRRIEECDETGIYLTNYETIRDGKMDPKHFNGASLDEASCFPAGTMIETENGLVPIERVKIGDKISNASGTDVVKDVFKTAVKRAIKLSINGSGIISSDNHPYFTKRGWVRAAELVAGDSIMETSAAMRLVRENHCANQATRSQKTFLRSELLREMEGDDKGRQGESCESREGVSQDSEETQHESTGEMETAENVRVVRDDDHTNSTSPLSEAILQQIVLCNVADVSTRYQSKSVLYPGEPKASSIATGVVCVWIGSSGTSKGKNWGTESDGQLSEPSEDFSNIEGNRLSSKNERREWAWSNCPTAAAISGFGDRLETGVSGISWETTNRLSDVLQVRPSKSNAHDRDRGGREFPSSQKGKGREKGFEAGFSRVDSVEVLERDNSELDRFRDANGSLYFYDLTATRHPSYSVDGLLVHNCLRGLGSTKTFREFMRLFDGMKYKFVATATPAPNDYIEILAYAAFLEIMDVGEAKTRFFKRNSEKADQLTIHPHKEREFWLWCASWALFITKPSDLGYSDDGYDLPPLDIRWHKVQTDHSAAGAEVDGQVRMFRQAAISLPDASREKRDSLPQRLAKLMEIRAEDPDAHRLIWHDLEREREAISRAIPGCPSVWGSQDMDEREETLTAFANGLVSELSTKPSIAGSGSNFQRHCNWEIFLGIGFKFNDFHQAIHRVYRFLQTKPVRIDLIYTEAETEVRRILEAKWEKHKELVAKMTAIIKEFGLAEQSLASAMHRSMGTERVAVTGQDWLAVNNDCVVETRTMESNSVGLVLTSIPFSTQYEYTPSFNDFGHTDSNDHFFQQMDFLTPELLRVLKPGRIACIHVKDRIVPGGINKLGFQTVYPFHMQTTAHFIKHGFAYIGMKTIVTDVVRENNQTYRLGWSEQCKDGSKMGVGMPEYLLIFRKPPTDSSNSYADEPVLKGKPLCVEEFGELVPFDRNLGIAPGTGYSRSRWQIDAHGFNRSSGDRGAAPEDWDNLEHSSIFQLFKKFALENVYNFEHHVAISESLEGKMRLPVTFMLLQPPSWSPEVWSDVTRMLSLNSAQSAKGREMHLCPMQFDIADRAIVQYTNPGDTVFDPFGGLGTVPYRALLKGRKGISVELNPRYFLDSLAYLKAAEEKLNMPTLFDILEAQGNP